MFIQGHSPPLVVTSDQLFRLLVALHAAGYTPHRGPRITRAAEVLTYRRQFMSGTEKRQNHVQIVMSNDHDLGVFAHTEPYGYGLKHFIAAICDKANYGAGAAMLLRDIKGRFID